MKIPFVSSAFNISKNFVTARPIFSGMVGALAVLGIGANAMRNNQIEQSQQGIQAAQQQIQAAQLQAAMQMEQAQAGGMMPNSAAPQIMGGSAQHMGMMDAAPELARG